PIASLSNAKEAEFPLTCDLTSMFAFFVNSSVIFDLPVKFTVLLDVLLRFLVKSKLGAAPAVTPSICAFVSDTGPPALAAPVSASTEMPAMRDNIFDMEMPLPLCGAISQLRSARVCPD